MIVVKPGDRNQARVRPTRASGPKLQELPR